MKINRTVVSLLIPLLLIVLIPCLVLVLLGGLRWHNHSSVKDFVTISIADLSRGVYPRTSPTASELERKEIEELVNTNLPPIAGVEIVDYFVGEYACVVVTEDGTRFSVVVEDDGVAFGLVRRKNLSIVRIDYDH